MRHSTDKFDFSVALFAPALEREFQANYYASNRRLTRAVAAFMVAMLGLVLFLSHYVPTSFDLSFNGPQIAFWLIVLALSWWPAFERCWQWVTALLAGAMAIWVLNALASDLSAQLSVKMLDADVLPSVIQQKFHFVMQTMVLLVSLATLRLQWRPALALYAALIAGVIAIFALRFPLPLPVLDARFSLLPLVVATGALLLTAFIGEGLARRAWWANHQLEIERNDERRAREQTEGNLKVLGQAIGGIVHDLGNPLTSVQMGASTLNLFLDSGSTDPETIKELTAIIESGSQMLNFLRLSLIEQTRVLEGQPIPVELKPTSALQIVQMGARFQKPSALGGRTVGIECPDVAVCADEMKMVTVWMNLIGNALKYSDGEVRVEWRSAEVDGEKVLVMAVLDAGTRGVGIARNQAAQLFRAFGRLENHAQIEGTGLGLLSVQKIVEAHGGEVWIEGFTDGTPASGPFSTAKQRYPTMLHGEFRTAFVATCPLAAQT